MIREFFAPRMMLLFLLFGLLNYGMLYIWMTSFPKQRRRFLRHARIPFIAVAISLVMCAGLALLIQFLN